MQIPVFPDSRPPRYFKKGDRMTAYIGPKKRGKRNWANAVCVEDSRLGLIIFRLRNSKELKCLPMGHPHIMHEWEYKFLSDPENRLYARIWTENVSSTYHASFNPKIFLRDLLAK